MFGATSTALSARSAPLIPIVLFAASAAFTLWRNSEIGVLVDIAYPLNTATRIAAGDVPYAQFPLAQAPLHFLVQAALIRLLGPHFVVQIAYATVLGGIATVLTYRVARRLLDGAVPASRAVATVLAIALVPIGIYAIYPHPFYDPDACLAILVALAAVLAARDRPTVPRCLLAGALLTVPLWIKQNIGGAFLVLAVAALAADAAARPAGRGGLRWCMAGLAGALGLELVALQLTIGIDHYLRWAWTFALAGRGVDLARIGAFADPRVVWPAALLLGPAIASQFLAPRARAAVFVAALCVPAIVGAISPSVVLAVPEMFPPILIAGSALAAVRTAREGARFETVLPLVVAGTTLGALLSQGLGSTFGIFPLLALALASVVRDLAWAVARPARLAPIAGGVLALLLLIGGSAYTLSNSRLLFIDVNASGPVVRSAFPSLAGLSARGPYIGDLDAMLVWTRDNIRPDEPMVFLPGEDPAFFALGRRAQLPSVYFYDVASPYSPSEIARAADEIGLRWVFVKERLQITEEPPLERAFIAALTERASLFAQVGPYRVYRRP